MIKLHSDAAISVDVCIVGYGPVGAVLASLLAEVGLSVVVVEREGRPYELPRAVHFDDEVMRVLQTIGVANRLLPHVHASPGMRFVDDDGRVLLDWSRDPGTGPQGWNVSYRFHQPDLERILREKVAVRPNIRVLLDTVVTAISQYADGAVVDTLHRPTQVVEGIHARYVVGCDGARSFVRGVIGSGQDDLGFREQWIVVDAVLRRPMPGLGDYSLQHCSRDRPMTYVRGVGNRRRWEIALRPGEDPNILTRPEEIYRLLSRWITPEDADLERAVCYTFSSVVACTWRRGRLLIAGDAAHETPPFLGQGMCAGIRDAANLAWKIVAVCEGRAGDDLLDTYQAERAPHVREYIALAVALGGLINTTNPSAALDGRQGMHGQPARMYSIKPGLGPCMAAGCTRLSGSVAPQPRLISGERLDDRVGYRFGALMSPEFIGSLPRTLLAACDDAGIAVVAEDALELQHWLRQNEAGAVMVRPDRYVLGAASSLSEMTDLVAATRQGCRQPAHSEGKA